MTQLAEDVGLHKHRLDLVRGREALELPVADGPHERRLAAVVASQQAVLVASLQFHLRVVEQDLRTVGERERAVAELLGVVVFFLLLLDDGEGAGRLQSGTAGRFITSERAGLGPVLAHERAPRGERAADADSIRDRGRVLPLELLRQRLLDRVLDLRRRRHLADLLLEALHELHALLADLAGLGVAHLVRQLHEAREQLRQEGRRVAGVVDELAHVADDERGLALQGRGLGAPFAQRARQQRHDHREGGRVDALDERRRGQRVDRRLDLLGVRGARHELGDDRLDVAVAREAEGRGHRSFRGGLHLLLRVPERGGQFRD
mmetsp:Transcript_7992/g.22466  ORF Transcript_7992/g.22466 Transcript_7992/m.22466 type:complete len:320 (-) Transcript_7992:515-1474(-)